MPGQDKKLSKDRAILLLSPYGGDNLGDGAIHDALITAIRDRSPDLAITGVNLDPVAVTELHRIPCHVISGLSVPFYEPVFDTHSTSTSAVEATNQEAQRATSDRSPRELIAATPVLGPALRVVFKLLRRIVGAVKATYRELGHTAEALRLSRNAVAIIVAGGGQIDDEWGGPWGHPYALFKWSILARLTSTPFCFLGVGYCELKSPLSRYMIRAALKNSAILTFRDRRSLKLSLKLADRADGQVIPDVAFSHPVVVRHDIYRKASFDVAISPIAYLSEYYWPSQKSGVYSRYIRELAGFCVQRLRDGKSLALFTSAGADDRPVKDLLAIISEQIPDTGQSISVVLAKSTSELLDVLSEANMVVASRLHGVVLSHLLSVPVVAIDYDKKVRIHMRDMGMSRMNLPIRTFIAADLESAFKEAETNREKLSTQIRHNVTHKYKALSDVYDRILNESL